MGLLEDIKDFVFDVGGVALDVADAAIDEFVPGGEFITSGVGALVDFAFGDDAAEAAGGGLTVPDGAKVPSVPGGGFGTPGAPGGDLAGPVYGSQSTALATIPPQAKAAVSLVLRALQTYPIISDIIQRRWNFAQEKPETNPHSLPMWVKLTDQLPKGHREALDQFLAGFPSPVGLTSAEEKIFLTLKIAESGYSGAELCCCK